MKSLKTWIFDFTKREESPTLFSAYIDRYGRKYKVIICVRKEFYEKDFKTLTDAKKELKTIVNGI
jgi:hypothetical protein